MKKLKLVSQICEHDMLNNLIKLSIWTYNLSQSYQKSITSFLKVYPRVYN